MENDENMEIAIEKLIQDKFLEDINNKINYIKIDLNCGIQDC